MAYRDETEALRARIAQLEKDNAALEEDNAALEEANQALLAAGPATPEDTAHRWLGGALRIQHTASFDGLLSPEAHDTIVALVRDRLGIAGETRRIGRSFKWRTAPGTPRKIELTLGPRSGRTHVELTEHLGELASGLFGGMLGGLGGAGAVATFPLAILVNPALLALAPLWAGVVYVAVRSLYARTCRERSAELTRLGRELDEEVAHQLTSSAVGSRRDPSDDDEKPAQDGADAPRELRARGSSS